VLEAATADLKLENRRLEGQHASMEIKNSKVVQEVICEKTHIQKQVLAMDSKSVWASARTYVQSIEEMWNGINHNFQAELLATIMVWTVYGDLCGSLLLDSWRHDIKKTNPY
jgi:hypothetical protein